MTDVQPAFLGEPQRFWTPARASAMPPRRPAPDLSDPAEFAARVELRPPCWQGPALLAGLAAFCLVCATAVPYMGLSSGSPETGRAVLLVLAGVFAAAAPTVLVWDLRTRAGAYRRAHESFLERGCIAQGYMTSLDIGHEEYRPVWVLIDSRVSDERAARLYAAFDTWIDAVLTDPKLRRRVVPWFRASSKLVPSESLFGPDAAGGYLVGPMSFGHWKLLMPKDGSAPAPAGGKWLAHSVLFADPAGEPVPTLGSGE